MRGVYSGFFKWFYIALGVFYSLYLFDIVFCFLCNNDIKLYILYRDISFGI